MSFSSVSGKNWLFKEFDSSEITKFSEDYSLTEIVAKLLSIRKKNIDNIDLFLNPKIKNSLPNPLHLKDMLLPRMCGQHRHGMGGRAIERLAIHPWHDP